MYVDDWDYNGLLYWYDELNRIHKQSKQNKQSKHN